MLYLDYLAYNNALKKVSISEKLLLGGGGLALALVLPRPVTLFAILAVMNIIMLVAGVPPRYLGRLWLAPLAFLLTGLVTIAVSIGDAPFAAVAGAQLGPYYIGITAAGLAAAQELFLRSVAAIACLFMIATTTPAAHVAAYAARIPLLGTVAEIALLTYRFIFVFLATAGQVYTAQQSRLGYADSRRSLSSLSLLAANVGRKTFLTARDLTIALSARNYRDKLTFSQPRQPVRAGRLVLIICILAVLGLTALL
jgi:cobalt/nickel transport system permease protein